MSINGPTVRLNRTPLTEQWEVVQLDDDGTFIKKRWPLHEDDAKWLEEIWQEENDA